MYPRSVFGRDRKPSGASKVSWYTWKVSRLWGNFQIVWNVSKKKFKIVFKISIYPNRIPVESC